MSNFNYVLSFTESIVIGEDVTRLYQYDIHMNDGRIGHIRISHNEKENEVVARLRVNHLEGYAASGTSRKMLEDLLYNVINHDTKARFMFDIDDMHTVALLNLSKIDPNLVIE